MSISQPPKLIIAANTLVGLYFAFLFGLAAAWGIDDDADLSKVAWGHLAFYRFREAGVYAVQVAVVCFVLSWAACLVLTRELGKTTKWATWLGTGVLLIMLCGAALGSVEFYLHKPVGP